MNTRLRRARAKGFTLIELMMVVAIIGLLAATAFPAYRQLVARARKVERRVVFHGLEISMKQYYEAYNALPPVADYWNPAVTAPLNNNKKTWDKTIYPFNLLDFEPTGSVRFYYNLSVITHPLGIPAFIVYARSGVASESANVEWISAQGSLKYAHYWFTESYIDSAIVNYL